MGATILGWLTNQNRSSKAERRRSDKLKLARMAEREQRLERQNKRLQIIFRLTAALNATLNYERVLELGLDLVDGALAEEEDGNSSRTKSAVFLFEGDRLRIASARGFSMGDLRTTLPGKEGIIANTLDGGDMCQTNDPALDPELKLLTALHISRVVICIPLTVGLKVYGLMLFANRRQDYFNKDRLLLLETVAQQVMIAMQNARLYGELEEEKERIVQIQDEERKKLARDLHDGPTQSVAAIAMRVNFARRLMQRDTKATIEELKKIEDLARQTTKEIRQMLFTLRPLILESKGLVPALEQLAGKMKEAYRQNIIIQASPEVAETLDANKQTVIFYIVEEAITNARKHAKANHVWVRMRRKGDLFTLEVEDDGVGFNVGAIDVNYAQRGSLGLVNLRERVELINGLLEIDSVEGRGTHIFVTVPLTEKVAERLHRPGFAA